jgi:hypothetical protein
VTVQRGQNESYPWWLVARLAPNGDEGKGLDVSVECRRTDGGWQLSADVAREDGFVLEECQAASASPGDAAEEALAAVEQFLARQGRCILNELGYPDTPVA